MVIYILRGALIKPWIFKEIKEQTHLDISSSERFDILKKYTNYGLEHWGSDTEVSNNIWNLIVILNNFFAITISICRNIILYAYMIIQYLFSYHYNRFVYLHFIRRIVNKNSIFYQSCVIFYSNIIFIYPRSVKGREGGGLI